MAALCQPERLAIVSATVASAGIADHHEALNKGGLT
jgi:hypothetical protein